MWYRLPACVLQRLSDLFEPLPGRCRFNSACRFNSVRRSDLSVQAGSLCYATLLVVPDRLLQIGLRLQKDFHTLLRLCRLQRLIPRSQRKPMRNKAANFYPAFSHDF